MRRVLIASLLLVAGCASEPPPSPARRPKVETVPPAVARTERTPEPVRPFGTVELDEHETPLARVIAKIADAADRPIIASVSTETLVTLTLRAAPWRDALDYL